jgi:hypothetical protein
LNLESQLLGEPQDVEAERQFRKPPPPAWLPLDEIQSGAELACRAKPVDS